VDPEIEISAMPVFSAMEVVQDVHARLATRRRWGKLERALKGAIVHEEAFHIQHW
jgi:hypothetical protein